MLQLDAFKNDAVRSITAQRQGQCSTIENCAPNSQHQSFGNIVTAGGLGSKTQTGALGSGSQPYRNQATRSVYDQKLSDARAQEQQEIQSAMRSGNNGPPATPGQNWPSSMQNTNSYVATPGGDNSNRSHLR